MNSLTIEAREGNYIVESDGHPFESRDIAGVLEIIAPEQKEEVERLLTALLGELNAEYISIDGTGERWYASAAVPVVKNYTNHYYDVEDYSLIGVLAALETAVRNGWDDESGLDAINRFLTWSWFV